MKMVKNKKIKIIFLGVCVGWGMNVLAQTPPVTDEKTTVAKVEEVKAAIPNMPTPTFNDDAWKPEQLAKDEKVGTWKLVEAGVDNATLKLKKIAVGDVNEIWAAGEDAKIYQLTPKGWEFKVAGIDVAATEDGTILIVSDKNELLKLDKDGEWEVIPGVKAEAVAAGNADAIWALYKGQVFHFDDGNWEKVKNMLGADAEGLTFFAVNAEEVVYALDKENKIYCRDLDRVELVKKTADLRKEITEKKKQEKAAKAAKKTTAKTTKAKTPKKAVKKPAKAVTAKKPETKKVEVVEQPAKTEKEETKKEVEAKPAITKEVETAKK